MKRALGNSGVSVSAIGLGCWAIGGPFTMDGRPDGWGDVDDAASERAIAAALDRGVTLFDTADAYGTGHSERVLGRALKGRRQDIVIATKFGFTYDETQKALTGTNVDPAYIDHAVTRSLERLGTDTIDLYQIHVGDIDADAATRAGEALERLVGSGAIRFWGWSTDDADRVAALPDFPHFVAIQQEMNLFAGSAELLALAERRGLASLIRSPLGMGLLTGKFTGDSRLSSDDVRGAGHSWVTYFREGRPDPVLVARLDAIKELLQTGGRTLTQGALSWLLSKSSVTIPIPGFKDEQQVAENAGAMDFGPLPANIMNEIDGLLSGRPWSRLARPIANN